MSYFRRPVAWFVLVAILFETALGVIAVGIGGIFRYWPLVGISGDGSSADAAVAAVGWGLIATAPMTAALAIVLESRWRPLSGIKGLAEKLLTPLIAGAHPLELVGVALAAGFGEEVLFRGLIQEGLAGWWQGHLAGWAAAWILASIIFGVCHWLSGTYALLAAAAGLYLGLLLIMFDHLLVPITAHAMYDLAALHYLSQSAGEPANA